MTSHILLMLEFKFPIVFPQSMKWIFRGATSWSRSFGRKFKPFWFWAMWNTKLNFEVDIFGTAYCLCLQAASTQNLKDGKIWIWNHATKYHSKTKNTCIHTSTQSTIKQALYLMIIWINYILRKIGIINHILSFMLEFFLKRLSHSLWIELFYCDTKSTFFQDKWWL